MKVRLSVNWPFPLNGQVERHEERVQHTTAVGAYKQADHQQDIANLLNNEQRALRKNNNELKRKIVR